MEKMPKVINVEPKIIRNSRNQQKVVTTERPLHTIVSNIVKRQVQKK